jgi:hypothetical protein
VEPVIGRSAKHSSFDLSARKSKECTGNVFVELFCVFSIIFSMDEFQKLVGNKEFEKQ